MGRRVGSCALALVLGLAASTAVAQITLVGEPFEVAYMPIVPIEWNGAKPALNADGTFALAWEADHAAGDFHTVLARIYAWDGSVLVDDWVVSTSETERRFLDDAFFAADDELVIAWQNSPSYYFSTNVAQRFSLDGLPLGTEVSLGDGDGYRDIELAPRADGGYVFGLTDPGVLTSAVDGNDQMVGPLESVAQPNLPWEIGFWRYGNAFRRHGVAAGSDSSLVVWKSEHVIEWGPPPYAWFTFSWGQDWLGTLDAGGMPSAPAQIFDSGFHASAPLTPHVAALPGEHFILVWEKAGQLKRREVDAGGNPVGLTRTMPGPINGAQGLEVRSSRDGYVLLWIERGASESRIVLRAFDLTGAEAGGIEIPALPGSGDPGFAMDATGRIVVAWSSAEESGGSNDGVLMVQRLLWSAGAP